MEARTLRSLWFGPKPVTGVDSPPGSIVVPKSSPPPRLTAIAYGPDALAERILDDPEEALALRGRHPVVWLNIEGLGDRAMLERIGRLFGIHALAMEDVSGVQERPKAETHGENLLIVLRMLRLRSAEWISEQIGIVVGDGFVLTFQEEPGDCLDPLRERLRRGRGRVRQSPPDYLAYAIIDTIVDGYYPAIEALGGRLDDLEDTILAARLNRNLTAAIRAVRRELLGMRRILWPVRELLANLLREAGEHISRDTRIYLRDCYDHIIQAMDVLEIQREISSGLMETYLSGISNRMNEIMKVLTMFATIFIPLTFIAGVYGMNFDPDTSPWNMPELKWPLGYFFSLAVMVLMAGGMLLFFFRRGWLGRDS